MASKMMEKKREAEAEAERAKADKEEAEERKKSAGIKEDLADMGEKVKKKIMR